MKNKNTIIILFFILNVTLLANSKDFLKYFLKQNNLNIFKNINFNDGPKEYFYPSGSIKAKEFYINNKRAGIWQYFYEGGNLKTEIFFSPISSKEEGIVKNYDKNGVALSDGKIERNEMVGNWNYYDENGERLYSYDYSNGLIISYDRQGNELIKLNEYVLAAKLKEIQQEIKNDRTRSIEEKN